MIKVLSLVIFIAVLTCGLAAPAHADSTTQVWPVTQAFGVSLSPDGDTLWVSSGAPTNTLTRIRTSDGSIEQVIDLSPADYPQNVAVSPDGLHVYVTAQNSSSISVVSTITNTLTRTISLGFLPVGIAVSPDSSTIFVVDYFGKRVVAITTTGSVLDSELVGDGPIGVTYSATDSRLYVSNQNSHSVSVIDAMDPTRLSTVGSTIPVGDTPRFLAVTPDGGQVWVPSQTTSTVSIIDTATLTVVDTVNAADASDDVAISPDGSSAFVVAFSFSPYGYGTLYEFDVATRGLLSTTELGFVPGAIAISPDGQRVYVKADGEMWVVTFSPEAMTGENAPTSALQQFELIGDATCNQVPEGFMDFPGIGDSLRNVGWSQSWAEWAQSGQGGPVCSRQPFYTVAGTWAVS